MTSGAGSDFRLLAILALGSGAGRPARAGPGGTLSAGGFHRRRARQDGQDEQARIAKLLNRSNGTERIVALRTDMYDAMESGAGIYRDDDSLAGTCDTLAQVRKRLANIQLDDRSNCFNTELTTALELENMIDLAEAVAHSARQRTESRGSHQRTDFPERDDQKYLKHSMAYRTDDGSPRLEYLDVVITKWPPAERTYGTKPVESNA